MVLHLREVTAHFMLTKSGVPDQQLGDLQFTDCLHTSFKPLVTVPKWLNLCWPRSSYNSLLLMYITINCQFDNFFILWYLSKYFVTMYPEVEPLRIQRKLNCFSKRFMCNIIMCVMLLFMTFLCSIKFYFKDFKACNFFFALVQHIKMKIVVFIYFHTQLCDCLFRC